MNIVKLILMSLGLMLGTSIAYAQDDNSDRRDADDLTMEILSDAGAASSEALTEDIALPKEANVEGHANSAQGLRTANDAIDGVLDAMSLADMASDIRESAGRDPGDVAPDRPPPPGP